MTKKEQVVLVTRPDEEGLALANQLKTVGKKILLEPMLIVENLPVIFRRYITYRASRVAATQLVANPNLVKLVAQQEALARAALMEYECNQGNHSMFGFPDNTVYQTYQPCTQAV